MTPAELTPEQIASLAAQVRQALAESRKPPTTRPAPTPEPHDLEQVRAQADKETKA